MNFKNNSVLYLSHGGGPLPLLGDKGHMEMISVLKVIADKIDKPSAILVISAHWEENNPTITFNNSPSLIYDYYGFPKESYFFEYPCPGEPVIANKVFSALDSSNLNPIKDTERGYDHGLFVPLKIMYPQADIPCIQLSLKNNLNPKDHIEIGKALQKIDYDDLLIIGSGFSFHNIRAFFTSNTYEPDKMNIAFDNWLIDTISNTEINQSEREERLTKWKKAPHADYCHPREEHLLPLHVCYGATQTVCKEYFEIDIMGKKASMYLW